MSRFKLLKEDDRLSLHDKFSDQKPLCIDFLQPDFLRRIQQAGKGSELVARAVKAGKNVSLVDCTAGLGRDGFILAHLGCQVTMLERSRVMYQLLEDGLKRAKKERSLAEAAGRIKLINVDAVQWLERHGSHDAVLIDPMFPEKQGSAAVKGPMQILQRYLGSDEDAEELLAAALASKSKRVVLKRPVRSDWLSRVEPTATIKSRNGMFEIYSSVVTG